ncbi:MAG: sporulation protein [Deltaproteobacteria bacterium]|nr:MAG: sporulation protein [Deltaproteobacteria bacterium]
MANKLKELLSSIIDELRQIATTETIVGNPVVLGDKNVVPVSRITVGFGVGGGEGESEQKGQGFGGGGGGGARVEPVGFIVIDGDRISFLPTKPGRLEGLIDAVPDFLTKVKAMRKGEGDDAGQTVEK